jgi:hypothetical protein
MTLNYRSPVAGIGSYADKLYNYILAYEAPILSDRLNGAADNKTIGVGFDLSTGGLPVFVAVATAMGMSHANLLTTNASENGVQANAERAFLRKLRVATTWAARSQVMAERADYAAAHPDFAAYIGTASPSRVFAFASEGQVRAAYNSLVESVYIKFITDKIPGLATSQTFRSSSELMSLLSLAWNGMGKLIGEGIVNALTIAGGNRADAWYEIRYHSNGGASGAQFGPGLAKRRFFEADVFGLYNDPHNVSATEAIDIYSMLQKHRWDIYQYEAKYGALPDGRVATSRDEKGRIPLLAANLDFSKKPDAPGSYAILPFAQGGAVFELRKKHRYQVLNIKPHSIREPLPVGKS